MAINSKVLQALILCIAVSFLIISCSDSGTNPSTPPEETGPPAPVTGLDNYPFDSEIPIRVTFENRGEGTPSQLHTRIDVYLPGDPEFEFSINEELISFERDTIWDAGPTDGVHYFNFEQSIPFGGKLDLELVYEDQTYSHTLAMPYSLEVQIPDSLDAENDFEMNWSIQEDPMYFFLGYSYASFDDEFNVIDDGHESFQLEGNERSFLIEQEMISEMANADTWNISISAHAFCFWEEEGILFRLGS